VAAAARITRRFEPKTRSWNGRKKAPEAQNKRLFPGPVPGFFPPAGEVNPNSK
jgi:hypothetical protein